MKAVQPGLQVIGGAVSPRGGDDPDSARLTHSPTTFIADLGLAYRATGRTTPIMDAFGFHPYGDNSSQSPTFAHPNTTRIGLADYGKLVALLGTAFDGTAQAGSTLPILYDEYGVESQIPAAKAALYSGARADDDEADGRADPGLVLLAGARSSRSASRTSKASCSSMRSTSRASRRGSRASTTRTARRSQACRSCAAQPTRCGAGPSRTATGWR